MGKRILLNHYTEWLKHTSVQPCRVIQNRKFAVTSFTLLHHHRHHFIIPTSSLVLMHSFKTQPHIVTTLHYHYQASCFLSSFDTVGLMSLNIPIPEKNDRGISGQTASLTVSYLNHKRKEKGFLSFL